MDNFQGQAVNQKEKLLEKCENQLDMHDVEILKNSLNKNIRVSLRPEYFDQYILSGLVYVDKSLYIEKILDKEHFFITAPQRWGKSLNLSMIKTFLQPDGDNEAYYNEKGEFDFTKAKSKNAVFFKGGEVQVDNKIVQLSPLKIANQKTFFQNMQGKYPVIMLNLKSVTDFKNFDEMKSMLLLEITKTFYEHQYIYKKRLQKILNLYSQQKEPIIQKYKSLDQIDLIELEYLISIHKIELQQQDKQMKAYFTQQYTSKYKIENSIEYLANSLYQFYKRQVYILVDEFDKPVLSLISKYIESLGNNAKFHKISKLLLDVSKFVTSLISPLVKLNIPTQVILTGIINSLDKQQSAQATKLIEMKILTEPSLFSEFFGFEDYEIDEIIEKVFDPKQDIKDSKNRLKEKLKFWYNGHNLSKKQMYNPFSIMSYFSLQDYNDYPQFQCFWEGSFTKNIITPILEQALNNKIDLSKYLNTLVLISKGIQQNLKIEQESIIKIIQDFALNIYDLLHYANLFNHILLKIGYLMKIPQINQLQFYQFPAYEIQIHINHEIETVWLKKLKIFEFKDEFSKTANQIDFYKDNSAQIEQNLEKLVNIVARNMHNINESICQSVLLMAFIFSRSFVRNQYKVQYECFSGKGRLDICFYFEDRADVIELKFEHRSNNDKVDQKLNEALEQIKEKQYDLGVKETIEVYKKNIQCIRFVPMIFYTRENDEKIYCKIGQTIEKDINDVYERKEQIENPIQQVTVIENFNQDSKKNQNPQTLLNQREKMTQNVRKEDKKKLEQSKRKMYE